MNVPERIIKTMLSTTRSRFLLLLTIAGITSVISNAIIQQNEYSNIRLSSTITQTLFNTKIENFENSIGMVLVSIPLETPLPSNLTEGRPYRTNGDFDEQPYHFVQITKSIFMSAYEVTNAQYKLFNPDHQTDQYGFSWNENDSVVMVSYYDAVEYCMWLSDLEGVVYRLPTEAEWEYATRSNTSTYFYMGSNCLFTRNLLGDEFPPEQGKFQQTSWLPGRREDGDVVALTVGLFPPNYFGLYDMHGNVEEWTSDWYGPYSADNQIDPVGPATGSFKVTRGGSHSTVPYYLRSANRMGALPSDRSWYIGFRVVMDKSAPMDYWVTQQALMKMQDAMDEDLPRVKPPEPETSSQSEPFLQTLQYVKVKATSDNSPPFTYHNHDPAVMPLPNGDVFAIWYTCYSESERELAVAYSRLPANGTEWEEAKLFWDTPDRNDHAPGLFFDYNTNTLYHYTSLCAAATWGSPATMMRMSHDYGYTWSPARFLMPEHELRHMVVETIFETSSGAWVMPCDNTTYSSGGTAVHISWDQGITWTDTGSDVLGIHGAILERDDGSFYAVGRGDDIDGSLARSISYDMGQSWASEPTGLPGIITYQRAVILKLAEGPLLYIGFSPSYMTVYDAQQGILRRLTGMFTALSYDNGQTWTDHKLVSHYTLGTILSGMAHTVGAPLQTLDGHYILQSWKIAEPQGYLSARQHTDGVIHLISSRQHYRFNYAWLTAAAELPPESDYHAILNTTPLTIAHLDSTTGHLISTTVVNFGVEGDVVGTYHNYLTQELFVWTFTNETMDPTFWVLDSEEYSVKRSWVHTMPKLTLDRPHIAAKLNQHGTVIYVVSSNQITLPNILIQQLDENGLVTKELEAAGEPYSITTPMGLFAETSNFISDNNLWIPVSCYSPITNTTYYTLIYAKLNDDYSELIVYIYQHEWWSLMFYDPVTKQMYFIVTDPSSSRALLLYYASDGTTQFGMEIPGYVTPCTSFDEVSLTWLLGCDTVYQYDTLSHTSGGSFSVTSPSPISFTYFGYHYS